MVMTPSVLSKRDHLRVCGADVNGVMDNVNKAGSSPRVRSRLPMPCVVTADHGIISACAEQTDRFAHGPTR